MDINSRIGKRDLDKGDEMLLQAPRYLIQRSHHKCPGTEQNYNFNTKAVGDLLTTVKKCKFKCYGHVTRSTGLAKTVLQGKRGR